MEGAGRREGKLQCKQATCGAQIRRAPLESLLARAPSPAHTAWDAMLPSSDWGAGREKLDGDYQWTQMAAATLTLKLSVRPSIGMWKSPSHIC